MLREVELIHFLFAFLFSLTSIPSRTNHVASLWHYTKSTHILIFLHKWFSSHFCITIVSHCASYKTYNAIHRSKNKQINQFASVWWKVFSNFKKCRSIILSTRNADSSNNERKALFIHSTSCTFYRPKSRKYRSDLFQTLNSLFGP